MIDKISYSPMNMMSTIQPRENEGVGAAEVSKQFGTFLNNALNKLQEQQATVDKLNQSFVKGELSDVHQLTIASEKASLGLELTVQVRNKVLEAYQEIMRTQL
jgi:flagellar hook-basal body complex protein FliE